MAKNRKRWSPRVGVGSDVTDEINRRKTAQWKQNNPGDPNKGLIPQLLDPLGSALSNTGSAVGNVLGTAGDTFLGPGPQSLDRPQPQYNTGLDVGLSRPKPPEYTKATLGPVNWDSFGSGGVPGASVPPLTVDPKAGRRLVGWDKTTGFAMWAKVDPDGMVDATDIYYDRDDMDPTTKANLDKLNSGAGGSTGPSWSTFTGKDGSIWKIDARSGEYQQIMAGNTIQIATVKNKLVAYDSADPEKKPIVLYEAPQDVQYFNTEDGIVSMDPNTGTAKLVHAIRPKPKIEGGNVITPPGVNVDVQYANIDDSGVKKQWEGYKSPGTGQDRGVGTGGDTPRWTPPVPAEDVEGSGNKFGQPVNDEGVHKGTDLQAVEGTPSVSPVDGKVIAVTEDKQGLGIKITVRDKLGNKHMLSHLKRGSVKVNVGDDVLAGDLVAEVGSTGNSTGPHLDYRIQDQQGNYENPEPLMPELSNMPMSPNTVGEDGQPVMDPQMMGMGGDRRRRWNPRAVGVGAAADDIESQRGLSGADMAARAAVQQPYSTPTGTTPDYTVAITPDKRAELDFYLKQLEENANQARKKLEQDWAIAQRQFESTNRQLSDNYEIAKQELEQRRHEVESDLAFRKEQSRLDESYRRDAMAIQQQQFQAQQTFTAQQNDLDRQLEQSRITAEYDYKREELQFNRDKFASDDEFRRAQQSLDEEYRYYQLNWQERQAERQHQMDLQKMGLQNSWVQGLAGMMPKYGQPGGPGWSSGAAGAVPVADQQPTGQQPAGQGPVQEPVFQQPAGGQQASRQQPPTQGLSLGQQLMGDGSAMPYSQFASMDPYSRSAWRANVEASGTPWGAVATDLRNTWAKQGITDAPGVTALQASKMSGDQMIGQNQIAETFGYTPDQFWGNQQKKWKSSASSKVGSVAA
jgi:murein DD-endopeptidase MepM/ murein hydrolase activator NlpD